MIQGYKKDVLLFLKTLKKLEISKIKIIIVFISMICYNIVLLINPLLFGNIINGIISTDINTIKLNLIYMIFVFGITILLNYITNITLKKITFSLDISMKEKVFASILKTAYPKFLKDEKGKLINNIENDVSIFSSILSLSINTIIKTISLIIAFCFMLYINPLLTLIAIFSFPITGGIHIYFGKLIKHNEEKYKHEYDNYFSFLNETLYGWKFLKLFNASTMRNSVFKSNVKSIYSLSFKKYKIGISSQMLTNVVTFFFSIINILVAVFLIFNGRLTLGMFTAFNQYSDTLKNILLSFSQLNSTFQESSVSIGRINSVLDNKIAPNFEKKVIDEPIKKIDIQNISYSTPDGIEVFKDANIEFYESNIYIIKGESGSGKTTLLNILINFLDDYTGKILLNNKELRSVNKESLRNSISYITQDIYLFSMSIKENIILYRNIPFNEVKRVCKQLNIHKVIMKLPNKYNTIINKDGSDLSGGERQRICIARAMVSNPDVYLFDEITSAIDQKNIKEIVKIIEEVSENAIVIISTHENLEFSIPTVKYYLENKKLICK